MRLAQLAGHRIWIPGLVPGVEWALYYDQLMAEFGLSIDGVGPHFGSDHLMDVVADSSDVASLVGEKPRPAWSDAHDLRRHLAATGTPTGVAGTWTPAGA